MYLTAKYAHVGCVVITIFGFCLRGLLQIAGVSLNCKRWAKAAPHVIDTILLLAAVMLMTLTGQYPILDNWLTAKILGLIVYIALGSIALSTNQSPKIRITAGSAALLTVGYIVSVALTKSPMGFLHR